jgi:hypothetical protein
MPFVSYFFFNFFGFLRIPAGLELNVAALAVFGRFYLYLTTPPPPPPRPFTLAYQEKSWVWKGHNTIVRGIIFSSSQNCLCKCYMLEEKTDSHYQVLQNVCVNDTHGSRRSHYQVLQNVCVNDTHGSRRSHYQVLKIV